MANRNNNFENGIENNGSINSVLKLYKSAIKYVPYFRHSAVVIACICIIAIIGFFKLGSIEVVARGVLIIIGLSFVAYLFFFLTNTRNKFIKYLMYLLASLIILSLGTIIIQFAIYSFTQKTSPIVEFIGLDKKTKYLLKGRDTTVIYGGVKFAKYIGEINDCDIIINLGESKYSKVIYCFNEKLADLNRNEPGNIVHNLYTALIAQKSDIVLKDDSLLINFTSFPLNSKNIKHEAKFRGKLNGNSITGVLHVYRLDCDSEVNPNFNVIVK